MKNERQRKRKLWTCIQLLGRLIFFPDKKFGCASEMEYLRSENYQIRLPLR